MFFLAKLFVLVSLVSCGWSVTYTNPLKNPNGSDPFIVTTGGYYYLLTTTWTNVQITRAKTLNGLKTGETKVVYSDTNPYRCCNVWAPEVHNIDGTWYLYYTAGSSANLDLQRVHVLKGGATPWDAFSYSGQVVSDWSLDATVMRFDNFGNYLVWSCSAPSGQALCTAKLNNPTSIGPRTVISNPTAAWEDVGAKVNEGPAALYHGGKTYLTYSASYCCTSTYQLGLLAWNGSGDPAQISSWAKSGPVFSTANGNYGTGHNRFFNSPDGSEIWNVYHATSDPDGACDGNRCTMAKKMEWNSDGSPNFGQAERLGATLQGPAGE